MVSKRLEVGNPKNVMTLKDFRKSLEGMLFKFVSSHRAVFVLLHDFTMDR